MEKLTTGYGLVEGPLWDRELGLIFSDVLNGGAYRIDANGHVHVLFKHRKGIGGMVRHVSPGLVVSGRNISYKPFDGGQTVMLLDRDEANNNIGYNDITTDSLGRIYAGSLGASPVFDDGRKQQSGDLYLVDLNGSARIVAEDIKLTNGLGFAPDGKWLYHSDIARQTINRYQVTDNGDLKDKQAFIKVTTGAPDGLAIFVDGRIWVALAGGGHGVMVFNPDGTTSDFIEIPQPMCTSVCFGGADLKILYMVSGSDGADADHVGAVYRTKVAVAGCSVAPKKVTLSA